MSTTSSGNRVPLRVTGTLALEITAISFVILFQELSLIRWIPSQVRVVAYFPNVVLMSAFLGLGIGCLLTRRVVPSLLWPLSLALLTLCMIAMSGIVFTQESTSEHLWLLYMNLYNPVVVNDIRLPILVCFVLSALSFVPLGRFLAERIAALTARGTPLEGYSLDLAGSLLGIMAFTVLAYAMTSPLVWFGSFVAVGSLLYARGSARRLASLTLLGVGVVAAVHVSIGDQTFSPYYALSTIASEWGSGPVVLTNGSMHQYPAPLVAPRAGMTLADRRLRAGYPAPYRLLRHPAQRVLVLGAGTGNDVAVALAQGATHVDAVEIDPVIVAMGRALHPDHPYADPRVTVSNDDARSFLEKATNKYDLVVFGTLDSMTRLSALSSIRLDNFVYTRECLEAARRTLDSDGGVVMYFWTASPYIAERLERLHYDAFGVPPAVDAHSHKLFNLLLMSGPAFDHLPRKSPDDAALRARMAAVEPSTDDWPYLYLRDRGISSFYLSMIALLALISTVAVFGASRDMRSLALRGRMDIEMACLGAAFLLLETKSVTEMNLAWGATWLTNAVVFGSILVMLLAATLLMQWRRISNATSLACLAATLIASYFPPRHLLLSSPMPAKLLLSIVIIGSPIFFASTLFAVRFRSRTRGDLALGWNLLGAVLGGLLEFSSMVIGIRALSLVALTLYLLSALAAARSSRGEGMAVAATTTGGP